jgi:putative heavy-metal chelation protein
MANTILTWATAARRRVLAGPTAPLWPRPFFERGVHVLGGVRILDTAKLLTIVGQGGSGYMFAEAAQKACLVRSASKVIATDHSALAANRPTDSTQTQMEAARMSATKRV